ncbi:hypothetical protein K438DRAFT_2050878 [Mycena galopus ATCC 62051]|nr:hypothetical protein K438DRAFT_2050878 [Mycena galopus ATCC 62051]
MASKSPSQNVDVLNRAGEIAKTWADKDRATFELIKPSKKVKWLGVILDEKLKGEEHIWARAASAARALNASLALTHAMWGLKPLMIQDLVLALVLPQADYRVSSFFPLPSAAFKPLNGINKLAARCITGAYRTASLAALEKEVALMPACLRLELAVQNHLARYLTLPSSHGLVPLIQDAINSVLRNYKYASPLHFIDAPPQGLRIHDRKKLPRPPEVTADTRADQAGSSARNKRGRTVNEPRARGLSPLLGDRQVTLTVPLVTSTTQCSQALNLLSPPHGLLGMELILLVYSAPWIESLPVSTIIPKKDQAVEILEALLADEGFAESTWFTDGSLLEGRAGGAAIRLMRGKQQELILLPLGEGQVMEGEVEGLLWATKSVMAARHSRILVVSDSQAGLKGYSPRRRVQGNSEPSSMISSSVIRFLILPTSASRISGLLLILG